MSATVKWYGVEKVMNMLGAAARIESNPRVIRQVGQLARALSKSVAQAAPLGPTGTLRRSIIGRKFQKKGPSIAFVAPDFRIAPHASMVEHGVPHRRYPRKRKALTGMAGGKRFFAKSVGPMEANAYFRDTLRRYSGEWYAKQIERIVANELRTVMAEAR